MKRSFNPGCLTAGERLFWTLLVVTMFIGYLFSLLQIWAAVGVAPDQIMTHYLGNEEQMRFGLAFSDLARLSHIHASGMALLLAPSGWLLARHVPTRTGWKGALLVSGFVGLLLDIGAWWGLVYMGRAMLPVLFLGGALFGVGMTGSSFLALKWLWGGERTLEKTD